MPMSRAAKFVRQAHESIGHSDFSAELAASHLSKMDAPVQSKLGELVMSLLDHWAMAYEETSSGHPLRSWYYKAYVMTNALAQAPSESQFRRRRGR